MTFLKSLAFAGLLTVGLLFLAFAGDRISPGFAWRGLGLLAAATVAAVLFGGFLT